jgi:signal transduction histidine kinase
LYFDKIFFYLCEKLVKNYYIKVNIFLTMNVTVFKQYKNFLFILLVSIVFMCVLIVSPLWLLSSTLQSAKEHANEVSFQLSMKINAPANIVRNYSHLLSHLVTTDLIDAENKRRFAFDEMRLRCKNPEMLSNLWAIFEPNAFDGMDQQYINTEFGKEDGVFNAWFMEGDIVVNSLSDDYDKVFYQLPKITKKEVFTDPYWDKLRGENICIMSFAVPILLDNNEFIGAAGKDFRIEDIIQFVNQFDGSYSSTSKIVTDKGVFVTNCDYDLIGSTNAFYDRENILSRLTTTGRNFEKTAGTYRVYAPITLGQAGTTWSYIVEIPALKIYTEIAKMISIFVIGILLFVSVFFYAKTVKQNNELKKLHGFKDKLFSVVAHEVRGSLATVINLIHLNETESDTELLQLSKDVSSKVNETYGIVINLLHWAKNQMKGGILTSPTNFDVYTEICVVVDALQNNAANKSITLTINVEKQQIYTDRDIFSIIVHNLIFNAIKYSYDKGVICVASERFEKELIISVTDNGVGMSDAIQKTIFKISQTKSQRGTKNELGTGLGLALCADFVKTNGGKIWFKSKEGEGTTFYFSVPL